MCNLSKGVMAKGMEQGILTLIKSLMDTMGWTIEQAMTALKMPETERQIYQNLMKSNHKPSDGNQIMVPIVWFIIVP